MPTVGTCHASSEPNVQHPHRNGLASASIGKPKRRCNCYSCSGSLDIVGSLKLPAQSLELNGSRQRHVDQYRDVYLKGGVFVTRQKKLIFLGKGPKSGFVSCARAFRADQVRWESSTEVHCQTSKFKLILPSPRTYVFRKFHMFNTTSCRCLPSDPGGSGLVDRATRAVNRSQGNSKLGRSLGGCRHPTRLIRLCSLSVHKK